MRGRTNAGGGGGFSAVIKVTCMEGAQVTCKLGYISYEATAEDGTCEFTVYKAGAWTVTAKKGADTLSTEADVLINGKTVLVNLGAIYGVSWDATSTELKRTDAAASFPDPVPYFPYGASPGSPFDKIMPWAGMVTEERTGGTMVAIPKFYYKLEQKGDGIGIKISGFKRDGYHISPAHMDRKDGKGEREVVYIGRYLSVENTYKSSSSGHIWKEQIGNAGTAIHTLGDNIWLMDFHMRFTLALLSLVEYASWDLSTVIGAWRKPSGVSTNNWQHTGYTDSMPYHTGNTNKSISEGKSVQYRNIENPWGVMNDWIGGCYSVAKGGLYVIPAIVSSTSLSGGTKICEVDGYVQAFTVQNIYSLPPLFVPSAPKSENPVSLPGKWDCGGQGFMTANATGFVFMTRNDALTGKSPSRIMELP